MTVKHVSGKVAGRIMKETKKIFFPMARQYPVDQALLIVDAWRLHANPPPSPGLLWTSDQPDEETSTLQNNTDKRQTSMNPVGNEPSIPSNEK